MTTISRVPARSATSNALSLIRSIFLAGLAIGVVGGAESAAFLYYAQGMLPVPFFQYIASGAMGQAAFAGGYETALIGLGSHFGISFVVAAVFLLAAAGLRFLRNWVFLFAPLYALAASLTMNLGVVPLSAAPKLTVTLPLLLNATIGAALYIGLPLAIVVWLNTHTVTITDKPWLTRDVRTASM